MAPTKTKTPSLRGSSGLKFTVSYLAAMVLLYIGERMVLESKLLRLILALVAVAGIAFAAAGRALRQRALPEQARSVEQRVLLLYLLGVVALIVYAAQADFVMDWLRPKFAEASSADRYQGVLTALWPTLWVCAVAPLVFLEISYAGMDLARTLELARIRRSVGSGAVLALTVSLIFVINYIGSEFNKKVDLSYFKTTRPSEPSRKMVQHLSEKLEAVLFFPTPNEVEEEASAFFQDLKRESPRFQVRVVDHVLEPLLAKELNVSGNGTVVLVRGKQHESIELGTQLSQAKRKLKRLDSEFQSAFRKVLKRQKVAYFTVGHEERTGEAWEGARGSSIRDLRTYMEQVLNFTLKDLGIAHGLGSEVPKDASVVIVPGPRKDLLPSEQAAILAYLRQGGRAMVFLDPESSLTLEPLLKPLGLRFVPARLANDAFNLRMTYTLADRHIALSNRFSAHPSVNTLTQHAHEVVTVMPGAGYLEEVPVTEGVKPQVLFTVHSMPETWNDVNVDYQFQAGPEQKKVYELAAVLTARPSVPAPKKAPAEKGEPPEMRLIVVADSDVIADRIFRNAGNGYLFVDGLKWLTGEEEEIGEPTSEEDVRITHTRKEDQLWFYLTIFAVPALVLGAGLLYTRAIRQRRKP